MKWTSSADGATARPAPPPSQGQAFGVFVGGIVVEHRVDRLVGRDLALDSVEEADEFEVAVALCKRRSKNPSLSGRSVRLRRSKITGAGSPLA